MIANALTQKFRTCLTYVSNWVGAWPGICFQLINTQILDSLLQCFKWLGYLYIVFHRFENQLLDFSSNRIKSSGDYFMSSATYVQGIVLCVAFSKQSRLYLTLLCLSKESIEEWSQVKILVKLRCHQSTPPTIQNMLKADGSSTSSSITAANGRHLQEW